LPRRRLGLRSSRWGSPLTPKAVIAMVQPNFADVPARDISSAAKPILYWFEALIRQAGRAQGVGVFLVVLAPPEASDAMVQSRYPQRRRRALLDRNLFFRLGLPGSHRLVESRSGSRGAHATHSSLNRIAGGPVRSGIRAGDARIGDSARRK